MKLFLLTGNIVITAACILVAVLGGEWWLLPFGALTAFYEFATAYAVKVRPSLALPSPMRLPGSH